MPEFAPEPSIKPVESQRVFNGLQAFSIRHFETSAKLERRSPTRREDMDSQTRRVGERFSFSLGETLAAGEAAKGIRQSRRPTGPSERARASQRRDEGERFNSFCASGTVHRNGCQPGYPPEMYCAIWSICTFWMEMIQFTRSPMETKPTTFSPSTTGKCRTRCSVISFMHSSTE